MLPDYLKNGNIQVSFQLTDKRYFKFSNTPNMFSLKYNHLQNPPTVSQYTNEHGKQYTCIIALTLVLAATVELEKHSMFRCLSYQACNAHTPYCQIWPIDLTVIFRIISLKT
jgi:hypothetical protein